MSPNSDKNQEPITLGFNLEAQEVWQRFASLPISSLTQGLYCVGRTGTGKTTFLKYLAYDFIQRGLGFLLVDPEPDSWLAGQVWALACHHGRTEDVVILDLTDVEYPFGANLFACDDPTDPLAIELAVERVVSAFRLLWREQMHSWGPRLEDLLKHVAYTFIEGQTYTLEHVPDFLEDDAFRARVVATIKNPTVKRYWQRSYDPLPVRTKWEIRDPVLNKVRPFLINPLLFNIVRQVENTVDFTHAIESKQIVIVKLDSRLEDATALLGSILMQQFLEAALSRPENAEPFGLICDEYHRYATSIFGKLIDGARKRGILTVLAHQRRSQLETVPLRMAPMGAINLVVFQVDPDSANELAQNFDTKPAEPVERPTTMPADVLDHLRRRGHTDTLIMDLFALVERNLASERRVRETQLQVIRSWEEPARDWYNYQNWGARERGRCFSEMIESVDSQWRDYDLHSYMDDIEQEVNQYLFQQMSGSTQAEQLLTRIRRLVDAGKLESRSKVEFIVQAPRYQIIPDEGARRWEELCRKQTQNFVDAIEHLGSLLRIHPILLPATDSPQSFINVKWSSRNWN